MALNLYLVKNILPRREIDMWLLLAVLPKRIGAETKYPKRLLKCCTVLVGAIYVCFVWLKKLMNDYDTSTVVMR